MWNSIFFFKKLPMAGNHLNRFKMEKPSKLNDPAVAPTPGFGIKEEPIGNDWLRA
jgi:hypothetical protein